jgi:hypothetical protein
MFRDQLHKYNTPQAKIIGPGAANLFIVATHFLNINTGETIKTVACEDERMGGKKGEYMVIPTTGVSVNGQTVWMICARLNSVKNELVSARFSY